MSGALVFLLFLFFAVHVSLGLYARTVVTNVAWEQARFVATHVDDPAAVSKADATARRELGGLRNVETMWGESANGDVKLTVKAKSPVILPVGMTEMSDIERSVVVRKEIPR